MMALVITYARNPYIIRRWEILRRTVQNSAEVSTSTKKVRIASDAICAPPTCFGPLVLALRQSSKKNRALFLWRTSKSVPATTRTIISTTYPVVSAEGMEADSSA